MHSLRKSILIYVKHAPPTHPPPPIKKEQYSEEGFCYRINIHIYISYKKMQNQSRGFLNTHISFLSSSYYKCTKKCLKTCIVCPFSIQLFSPEIQKPSCVFMGYIPARELYTHYLIDMSVVWFLSEFETRSRACVYFNFLNNN